MRSQQPTLEQVLAARTIAIRSSGEAILATCLAVAVSLLMCVRAVSDCSTRRLVAAASARCASTRHVTERGEAPSVRFAVAPAAGLHLKVAAWWFWMTPERVPTSYHNTSDVEVSAVGGSVTQAAASIRVIGWPERQNAVNARRTNKLTHHGSPGVAAEQKTHR